MVFKNMNEALKHFGLGKLKKMYDKMHAYGRTDKRKQVWLPIIPEAQGQHKNLIFGNYNGEDLILERDTSGSNTVKEPDMITSHVITREEIGKKKYDYKYIGEYKQVLFDKSRRFTVHIKVPSFIRDGDILYYPDYVKTANEARQKIEYLWNEGNEE